MKYTTLASILGLLFVLVLSVAPANAQASRTWVSGVGDDLNPCSRTAPCKTFAGAISKTATNGEINCLDSGGFGAVTITKGLTIDCVGVTAGVLASGSAGIIINVPAGSVVTLRGLDIHGAGTAFPGTHGINIISPAVVHIENVKISSFAQNGIRIAPSTGGASVTVSNSLIIENGADTNTGGITVQPTGSASVVVIVDNSHIEGNSTGIVAGPPGSGTVKVIVRRSTIFGNDSAGVLANSSTGATNVFVDRCAVASNAIGLQTSGASSSIIYSDTVVANNVTGLQAGALSKIFTYQNNRLVNNTSDGLATNTLGPN